MTSALHDVGAEIAYLDEERQGWKSKDYSKLHNAREDIHHDILSGALGPIFRVTAKGKVKTTDFIMLKYNAGKPDSDRIFIAPVEDKHPIIAKGLLATNIKDDTNVIGASYVFTDPFLKGDLFNEKIAEFVSAVEWKDADPHAKIHFTANTVVISAAPSRRMGQIHQWKVATLPDAVGPMDESGGGKGASAEESELDPSSQGGSAEHSREGSAEPQFSKNHDESIEISTLQSTYASLVSTFKDDLVEIADPDLNNAFQSSTVGNRQDREAVRSGLRKFFKRAEDESLLAIVPTQGSFVGWDNVENARITMSILMKILKASVRSSIDIENATVEKTLATVEKTLAETRDDLAKEREAVTTANETLGRELGEAQEKLSSETGSLNEELEKTKSSLEERTREVATQEETIKGLNSDVKRIRKSRNDALAKVTRLEDQLERSTPSRTDEEIHAENVAAMKDELGDAETERNNAFVAMEHARKKNRPRTIAEAQENIDAAEAKVAGLEAQLGNLKKRGHEEGTGPPLPGPSQPDAKRRPFRSVTALMTGARALLCASGMESPSHFHTMATAAAIMAVSGGAQLPTARRFGSELADHLRPNMETASDFAHAIATASHSRPQFTEEGAIPTLEAMVNAAPMLVACDMCTTKADAEAFQKAARHIQNRPKLVIRIARKVRAKNFLLSGAPLEDAIANGAIQRASCPKDASYGSPVVDVLRALEEESDDETADDRYCGDIKVIKRTAWPSVFTLADTRGITIPQGADPVAHVQTVIFRPSTPGRFFSPMSAKSTSKEATLLHNILSNGLPDMVGDLSRYEKSTLRLLVEEATRTYNVLDVDKTIGEGPCVVTGATEDLVTLTYTSVSASSDPAKKHRLVVNKFCVTASIASIILSMYALRMDITTVGRTNAQAYRTRNMPYVRTLKASLGMA